MTKNSLLSSKHSSQHIKCNYVICHTFFRLSLKIAIASIYHSRSFWKLDKLFYSYFPGPWVINFPQRPKLIQMKTSQSTSRILCHIFNGFQFLERTLAVFLQKIQNEPHVQSFRPQNCVRGICQPHCKLSQQPQRDS